MFRRSRRKIVAAIMSVLVLLWVGTLGVIYASSYFEMKKQNEQMLYAHAQMYNLPNTFDQMMPPNGPRPDGTPVLSPVLTRNRPSFNCPPFTQ